MKQPVSILPVVLILTIMIFCLLFWNFRYHLWLPIPHIGDCHRSFIESDSFICEPDFVWNERKILYHIQDQLNMIERPNERFFQSNWEPNFNCSYARRIGSMGDGGKWVCDPFRLKDRYDCLIYSAGSNGDFSFEIDLKKVLPHCEIHTFDQDVYVCPNNVCIFHQIVFGNGIQPNGSKTWKMIIEQLNHTNKTIDVFKIDIEGGEYAFFPSIFSSTALPHPRQILVELHPRNHTDIHSFFRLLRHKDYVIFNKEPNLGAGYKYFEYAFLKLNSRFFSFS